MRKNLFLIAIVALYSGSIMASEIIGIEENASDHSDPTFEYLESPKPSPVQLTFKDILGYGLNKSYKKRDENWVTRIARIVKNGEPIFSSRNFNNAHTNVQEAQQAMTESENTELPHIQHNELSDSFEDVDSEHTDLHATESTIDERYTEKPIESFEEKSLEYIIPSDQLTELTVSKSKLVDIDFKQTETITLESNTQDDIAFFAQATQFNFTPNNDLHIVDETQNLTNTMGTSQKDFKKSRSALRKALGYEKRAQYEAKIQADLMIIKSFFQRSLNYTKNKLGLSNNQDS